MWCATNQIVIVMAVTTDGEKVLHQSKSNAFLNPLVPSAIGHKKHTWHAIIWKMLNIGPDNHPGWKTRLYPKWWLWYDVLMVALPCVQLVKISLILQRLMALSSQAFLLSMCSLSALLFLSLSLSLSLSWAFHFLATLRPLAVHTLAVLMCVMTERDHTNFSIAFLILIFHI